MGLIRKNASVVFTVLVWLGRSIPFAEMEAPRKSREKSGSREPQWRPRGKVQAKTDTWDGHDGCLD
jgi:hypothetical protein